MLVSTPPMGWSTWNTFGENINEQLVRECADAMADLGFAKAGYTILGIDDGWSEKQRSMETGSLVPSREKFPHGMKAIGDYIHSRGLKFGMYTATGFRTCADYPGSYQHEYQDAADFAAWGADYVKVDYCMRAEMVADELTYRTMGMALRASGRDMIYSVCQQGRDDVWKWARSTGAHMYRSTHDILDNRDRFMGIALSQIAGRPHKVCEPTEEKSKLCASAPQCFNDFDMMTVGMYGGGYCALGDKCTMADYRTQFALWCMSSSPLMMGSDIRSIDKETAALLQNSDLIRINQDSQCRQPIDLGLRPTINYYQSPALVKHLDDGTYAIAMFNLNTDRASEEHICLSDIGLTENAGYDMVIRDVFTGEEKRIREYYSTEIPAGDCSVYIGRLVKR